MSPLGAAWAGLHPATRILAVELVLIGAAVGAVQAAGLPLLLPYSSHKFLHLLGVVLFLGNIVVTAMWMVLAVRSGSVALAGFAARGTVWTDVAFTAPGVFLILVNGFVMSARFGGPGGVAWIAYALGLFGVTGIVWVGALVPLQEAMIRSTRSPAEALSATFRRAFRWWSVAGAVATVIPLVILALMVMRPSLGG